MHATTMLRVSFAIAMIFLTTAVAAMRQGCDKVLYEVTLAGDSVVVDAHPSACSCILKSGACDCASGSACSDNDRPANANDMCLLRPGQILKGAPFLLGCHCLHKSGKCGCHALRGGCSCQISDNAAAQVMEDAIDRVKRAYPGINPYRGAVRFSPKFDILKDAKAHEKLDALSVAFSQLSAQNSKQETEKLFGVEKKSGLARPLALGAGVGVALAGAHVLHKISHMSAEERKARTEQAKNVLRNVRSRALGKQQPVAVTA